MRNFFGWELGILRIHTLYGPDTRSSEAVVLTAY